MAERRIEVDNILLPPWQTCTHLCLSNVFFQPLGNVTEWWPAFRIVTPTLQHQLVPGRRCKTTILVLDMFIFVQTRLITRPCAVWVPLCPESHFFLRRPWFFLRSQNIAIENALLLCSNITLWITENWELGARIYFKKMKTNRRCHPLDPHWETPWTNIYIGIRTPPPF